MDLAAQPRNILGKKVKALRRQGITPIHMFGPGIASEALQADTVELQQTLAAAGPTTILKLNLNNGAARGGRLSHDVMVRGVQRDPVTGQILHVDFFRVEMSHPVAVDIPLALTGLSPAVDNHLGTLVHGMSTLHVQGLPGDLPSAIEVDVSILAEPHQAIHARDVALPPGLTLLSDGDGMVANIVPPRGAEEVAVAEAEAPAPAAAGEAPAAEEPEGQSGEGGP